MTINDAKDRVRAALTVLDKLSTVIGADGRAGWCVVAVMTIVCAVLAAGCVAADRLFPRIPIVERYIAALPLGDPTQHACRVGRGGTAEWTRPAACRRDEGYGACDDEVERFVRSLPLGRSER